LAEGAKEEVMLSQRVEHEPVTRGVEYRPLAARAALRPSPDDSGAWHWTLNPYQGCEVGCTFCSVRLDQRTLSGWLDFERRIGVKTHLVEAFLRDLRADAFQDRPIVVGSDTEPWQPAEEQFRITRSILAAMAEVDGLDVRIQTRSSLIARDTDVLLALQKRNRLAVSFSLPSVDDRINRLVEPRAPSAMRRLAALEALSRAGIQAGLVVSPVLAGLEERELGLAPLLSRAANAGAHFAGLGLMRFGPGQREVFLDNVTAAHPDAALRLRRVIGRRSHTEEEKRALTEQFRALCGRLGLVPLADPSSARGEAREEEPAQMALFADAAH
jgi:DNA repair photolyase